MPVPVGDPAGFRFEAELPRPGVAPLAVVRLGVRPTVFTAGTGKVFLAARLLFGVASAGMVVPSTTLTMRRRGTLR